MCRTSPACHVMPSCIVSSVALIRDTGRFTMVAIAQSVEHLIVVQEVARSSRVSHPISSSTPDWEAGGLSYMRNVLNNRILCAICVPKSAKI